VIASPLYVVSLILGPAFQAMRSATSSHESLPRIGRTGDFAEQQATPAPTPQAVHDERES
jgi:hypothetical protein